MLRDSLWNMAWVYSVTNAACRVGVNSVRLVIPFLNLPGELTVKSMMAEALRLTTQN